MPYIDQETKLMIKELHQLVIRHNHTLYGEKGTMDNGVCGDVARNRDAVIQVDRKLNKVLIAFGVIGFAALAAIIPLLLI